MNRYPLWKYVLIVLALAFGALYSIPNIYPDAPALQISSGKSTVKIDPAMASRVEQVLKAGNLKPDSVVYDSGATQAFVRARFADTTAQFNAKALLEKELNADPADPTYLVAFNLLSTTPNWMQKLNALPMYLGLDLRGGVHFLMQVDVKALTAKQLQATQGSMRSMLREENIRHNGISREGESVVVRFADAATSTKARRTLTDKMPDYAFAETADGADIKLAATLKPEALKRIQDEGVDQNINSLSKRINELGVSEPIIQRQGADRIVVQLPGVQDVAHAKDIIGRTATLEVRATDDSVLRGSELTATVPLGSELFKSGKNAPVVLSKEVVITGDYISGAQASFDQQQQPIVSVQLNAEGGRKMRAFTRNRVGKPMAIVLFEKGKGEVISVANVNEELGANFQISGGFTPVETAELSLLLRAGSLAAPMDFVEERTIGPQLGAENIAKGLYSTMYGFIAIAIFMILYYHLFGVFSVLALAVNLLLLVALLSLLHVTVTLPGIAAIALALGMAIDANVLINERVREELRGGATPQAAIAAGFDRAWATILDSNVTTLIVGISLLAFGSGAVRGFAVVHSLGILTSMFSAVFVSRGVVNLWYGRKSKKKMTTLSIGTVWKPE
ncbi:MAG TPA: protein translocase subunit SecD [Burkholderiaceae bacterium]